MNKIALLTLCTLTSLVSADNFIDAIDNRDLPKVVTMIKQKEYNPSLYFEYLTAAQDSLTSARDSNFIQKIQPKSTVLFSCLAAAFAIWNGYTPASIIMTLNNKILLDQFQMNVLNKAWNQLYITAIGAAIIFGMGIKHIDGQKEKELKHAEMIYKLMIRCRELFFILNQQKYHQIQMENQQLLKDK